jgi:type IV secretion system protein VirD4
VTSKYARTASCLALGAVFAVALASPAFAQTTSSVGGNLGTSIQTLTSRMNLWLNPRVCAATEDSDFDLRELRSRRMSIYLAVTPDNLTRVAPLYNLLFQQLVDLNTRERPGGGRHPIPVLLLLDEFARLGHAEVLAKAFAFVAGYGLRLLPVLQSPSQLRAEYGPDLAQEVIANCAVEIAFAPKELKVAQELSERLGAYTYKARSQSAPTLLSKGTRSTNESDQRRLLNLPQELLQMSQDRLLVLHAGLPPIRGRKIVYWRERLFTRRVLPPPQVPARPIAPPSAPEAPTDPLVLQLGPLAVAGAETLAPLPPIGASAEAVEDWVDRYLDAAATVSTKEPVHG